MQGERPCSPVEIEMLSHAINSGDYAKRKVFMFWFAYRSGWKEQDYLDLKMSDLFDHGRLRLNIPCLADSRVRDALKAWLPELEAMHEGAFGPGTFICSGRVKKLRGQPTKTQRLTRVQWWRDFDQARKSCHIPDSIGPESLRKTFAKELYYRQLAEGGPRFGEIARALGLKKAYSALQYLSFIPGLIDMRTRS